MTNLLRAIVHIDMDAFFASVAQQQEMKYKGTPVITGSERAIATSISYEAKALGVTRGMPAHYIKKQFPNVHVLPSDYETIGLFSSRLFAIVRKYTEEIEEYSVDECFADLTGIEASWGMTYEEIAREIQQDIRIMLGATGSVGLAPTKALAKIASKWKKPNGFTMILPQDISAFLACVPIGSVWGIGKAYERHLQEQGIKTARDFINMPYEWIKHHGTKPIQELWKELRGEPCWEVQQEQRVHKQSISRHRTFWPHTNNREDLLVYLAKNIEHACAELRREGTVAARGVFGLRLEDFSYREKEIVVPEPTAEPQQFVKAVQRDFEKVHRVNATYRATFFTLIGLHTAKKQCSLFEQENKHAQKQKELYRAVDSVNRKFGKHTVHLGASLERRKNRKITFHQQDTPWRKRKENWLPGETQEKKVNIPYCGWVA